MLYASSCLTALTRLPGLFVVALALALSACGQEAPVTTTRLNAFGTQIDLSLVGIDLKQAREATALIEQELASLEKEWHPWQPGPMGRVNQLLAAGDSFVASPSIMPLVRLSQLYETQSDGLFNPAIGYLMDLWGFHADAVRSRPPPPAQQITRLLETKPSMHQITIDGLELRGSNPSIKLDFDAIAKGYAMDMAVDHLRDLGIKSAQIQAGGEVRVIGDRAGQPWRPTIRRASGSGVLAIAPLRGDESLVTKADYDRNFVFKGAIYHAILDPRTGSPAERSRSVTVLHQDATTAAAAATALFIAGPEDMHAVAVKMGVRYVLLIDAEGTLHMNPAMADRIELVDTSAPIVLQPELVDTVEVADP